MIERSRSTPLPGSCCASSSTRPHPEAARRARRRGAHHRPAVGVPEQRSLPTDLRKLATALGVEPKDLVSGEPR